MTHWTRHRREAGAWHVVGTVAVFGEHLIALSCGLGRELALTDRRLIDLTGATPALTLSEPLRPPIPLSAAVLITADAVFVGINMGEWGGGLRRIDRRTGRIAPIERNANGGICDGPLNTGCDPVNGIAAIPWRPHCVAAAIGLIHMAAHGRIASICPEGVEQMFVATDALDPGDPANVAEATTGGMGSVAFFGLTATANAFSRSATMGFTGLVRTGWVPACPGRALPKWTAFWSASRCRRWFWS